MRVGFGAIALCLSASVIAAGVRQARADGSSELRVTVDSMHGATIVLAGGRVRATSDAESVLALYVGSAPSRNTTAVAGTYEFSDTAVVFRPYFALVPGVEYTAVARIHAGSMQSASLTKRILVPAPPLVARASVVAVYPTADTLPENVLKFYVHFSRQMRDGDAAAHVALLDEDGHVLTNALLGSDFELWDRSHRRLTILLDPGRIKRGLRPNQEFGAPLIAGRRYRLRIDSAWRDADGAPLVASHEKSFIASAAIRSSLSIADWRVTAPAAGTTDPIELRLPRAIDHALAARLVRVDGPSGSAVRVTSVAANDERTIRLVPRVPWIPGRYRVLVGAQIEDLAGNSLQRLFDVERLVHIIQINPGSQNSAVQIKLYAAGQPRAVIRENHVRPLVQGHSLLALQAYAVVQPALDQIGAQAPVPQHQAESLTFGFIARAADDGPRGFDRVDPCGQGEAIVETEIPDVAYVHIPLSVKLANLTHRRRAVLRISVFPGCLASEGYGIHDGTVLHQV